ncbi:MAG: hypothetical protein RLZZ299_1050 [Pseudomonadota bacterium]
MEPSKRFVDHPRIQAALAAPGAVWVTDADGTLWADDIGEGFLRALARDGALRSPEAQGDVWAAYEARVRADKAAGYAWAVQVMAGMTEAEVERRAEAYAQAFVPRHLHPAMAGLLAEASERGVETWIVSASNAWVVRAAARVLGLPPARALGIRVAVEDGVLTDRVVPPVTYADGKVAALRAGLGRMPSLASGDSRGDAEMLAAAGTPLVVRHAGVDPAFLDRASASGWLVLDAAEP